MNEMLKQFNLPKYIDGLSFADASKKIQSKFKERSDVESVSTERDMLDRLKQMQEYVKEQEELRKEPERSNADLVAGSEGMPLQESEVTEQYEQEQGLNGDLMNQIQNAYGGNEYAFGGGLSSKDRGSYDNPYPSVDSSDFAGKNRSYPIPTKEDAVDALRLAGLHGRDDIRSKVFNKYPELDSNQKAFGGYDGEETPIKKGDIKQNVLDLTGISEDPTNMNMDFDTKKIVRHQPGVTSGKSGKSGFYLYSKNVDEPGFDPKRHREFINQEEMMTVQRTPQWKEYMQTQSKMALGGPEMNDYNQYNMNANQEQRFAPTIYSSTPSISESISSFAKNSEGNTGGTSSNIVGNSNVTEGAGPGIAGYAKMGMTAMDLGNEVFGPTGVDTSGRVNVQEEKIGNSAISGASKGASAGMALGPWGAAAGAVVGGVAGIIGAKRQKKDAAIANRNATYAKSSENNNQFKKGGNEDNYIAGKIDPKTKKRINIEPAIGSLSSFWTKRTDRIYTGKDDLASSFLADSNYQKEAKIGNVDLKGMEKKSPTKMTTLQKIKLAGMDASEFIGDNKDALRYAPAVGNLLQLSKLKKPDQETTGEISTRYKPQFTDENAIANLVREETNATREAILNASEGSGSSARANLLASQLGSTKALSDAYLRSSEQNNAERRQEQSFNLGIDTANLQQQNLAQDIRARNKGAYETEKSRLMAAIANDLGAVGQEELYKKFPELMGADYDWKGRYKKRKQETSS